MNLEIREAAPHDEDAIAALSRRLYEEHPGPLPMTDAKVRASLAHFRARPDRGLALVATEAGRVVGFAFVAKFWSNEYGGDSWILDELSVDPSTRGRGTGAALLAAVEARARLAGVPALMLELDDGNPAGRLYERTGWTDARRRVFRRILS